MFVVATRCTLACYVAHFGFTSYISYRNNIRYRVHVCRGEIKDGIDSGSIKVLCCYNGGCAPGNWGDFSPLFTSAILLVTSEKLSNARKLKLSSRVLFILNIFFVLHGFPFSKFEKIYYSYTHIYIQSRLFPVEVGKQRLHRSPI